MRHNNGKGWDVIYADFPWPYTAYGTAKLPYGQMPVEEIKAFPLDKLMADRCVLLFWVTCPHLYGLQKDIFDHWSSKFGLTYQGVPYIWIKTKRDGTPIGAQGVRPRMVKPVAEFVVAFSNTKWSAGRPLPLETESQRQVIFSPKGAHSEKPSEVRERIVELFGDVSRLELFSRHKVPGWDGWGDQYPGDSAF